MSYYNLPDQLQDIQNERNRQEDLKAAGKFKFTCADPEMSNMERYAVLGEEVGEVARAILCADSLATDKNTNLREELVQVAAVALAWIEGLDAVEVQS